MEYKALIAIVALLLAASTIDSVQEDAFVTYKTSFGKSYSDSEEKVRHAIFLENVAKINAHNADATQTYKMGIN